MGKEAYRKPVMDVVELEDDMILTSTGQSCMDACGGDGIAQCDCSVNCIGVSSGGLSGGTEISGGGTGTGCAIFMGGSGYTCGVVQP